MHITIAGLDKRDSIFYEAGNDLLDRGVCSIHLPLCYCASVIHATRNFFYLLSPGDDNQSYFNQRFIEGESCDT